MVLSHWHEDHISGNRLLQNARYYAHKKDKQLIENINNIIKEYYCVLDTPAEDSFDIILEGMFLKETKIDCSMENNDIIKIGDDYILKVIHTPGHSAGHCCFLELNSKIAFLADIDLTSFGPWYAGLDSSLIDFEESISKLLQLDIEIAVTSHKGVVKGGRLVKQKLNEYQAKIDERDKLILENLSESKPITSKDLIRKKIIYKFYSEFEAYEIVAEKIMLDMHFDKFLKNNLIEQIENGYILS